MRIWDRLVALVRRRHRPDFPPVTWVGPVEPYPDFLLQGDIWKPGPGEVYYWVDGGWVAFREAFREDDDGAVQPGQG